MSELLYACVPPTVAAGAGFALYKVLPEVFSQIRELFGNYFYKTVYVTLGQNKVKFLHLIKFMSKFKVERDCKAVIISTDDGEYEVPLLEIRVTSDKMPEIAMKAHVDGSFNINYIEISVHKRDLFSYNETKIVKFDGFMRQFPSVKKDDGCKKQLEEGVKKEPVKQIEAKKEDDPKRIKDMRDACQTPHSSPIVDPKVRHGQPTVDLRRNGSKRRQPVPAYPSGNNQDLQNLRNRFVKIGEDAKKIQQSKDQPIDLTTLAKSPLHTTTANDPVDVTNSIFGTNRPIRRNTIIPKTNGDEK